MNFPLTSTQRKRQRKRRRKLAQNRRQQRASRLERLEPRYVLDGAIAGTVFGDIDNDGQLDGGELGVEGRTVFLDIGNDGTNDHTAFTNGDGQYSFDGVPVGTHKVTQSLSGGVFQTGLLQPTSGNIFLDIPNRLDQSYDPIRGILYVTRRDNSGTIDRYDVVNGVGLEPFHVGARAGAVAATTNGKFLLVGEAMRGLTSFIVHKVDANNGQILATMHHPQSSLESGVYDIAVVSDTTALVTTSFAGSGWVPLHKIDLTTDTMTRRPFDPAGAFDALRQNSRMTVSGDGKTTFFGEANISSGPIHLYDSVTDSFIASSGIGEFVDNKATAINHDGTMIAISHGGRIKIYDRDFNLVDDTIAEHAFGLAFSADSQFIYALSGNSQQIEIYRLSDGANVGEIEPGESFSGAFGRYEMLITHDGTTLIMQSRAGVRVYPIFEAAPHFVTVGPDQHVSGVDFGLFANSSGPGAHDDELSVPKDAVAAPLDVLANDFVTPGVSRWVTAFSATTAGGTPLIDNGNLFYTPPAGFVGKDSFFYTLTDGNNASDTAQVTVHVGVPNGNESITGQVVDENSQGIPGATLFLDLNNNGVHNEGEPTTGADANGHYSFNNLSDDVYTLRQNPEPGYDLAWTATGAGLRDFIPMPNRASFAYDESREALWILEAPTLLWHYDLATEQMVDSWDLGERVSRIDIAPDDSFALITGPNVVDGKASVLRIDLTTKAVTKLEYAVGGGESNSFDIAIYDQGFALFSGKFSGSGWVPIRKLDLTTNAITARTTAPTSVRQDTNIYRSQDRQHGLVAEANASNGPVSVYDPATDSFPIGKGIQEFAGRLKADVTSTYFAGNTTTATSIVEMSTLDTIEILDAQGGAVAFDHSQPILYAADMNFDELRAYDTNTWERLYSTPLGENIGNAFYEMGVNSAGSILFTTTPAGIRFFDLERSTAKQVAVVDGGRTIAADFSNHRNGDNRRPFAPTPTPFSLVEDETLSPSAPGLLEGAFDPDGDSFFTALRSQADNGSVEVRPDGSFTYTPSDNFHGQDSFSFIVTDGSTPSLPIQVLIDIARRNDAPSAQNDGFLAIEDLTLNIPSSIGVLKNDSDADGDPINATLVDTTSNGSLALNSNGSFSYSPADNFSGRDSFTYFATDGKLDSDTVTVTIDVAAVQDKPVVEDDDYSIAEDNTLEIAASGILVNDRDDDGETLHPRVIDSTAHGKLTLRDNGSFTYVPNDDFVGDDSFTYRVNDGTEDSDVATVSIEVTPVDDAPQATGETISGMEDKMLVIGKPGILSNDLEVDGQTLSAVLVEDVANGILALKSDGSFSYDPEDDFNGLVTFKYKASDGNLESDVVEVKLDISPVNDAPTIGSIPVQEYEYDVPATLIGPTIGDVDAGSNEITVTLQVGEGDLHVATVAGGVAADKVTGTGSDTVELRGSVDQINQTLVAGAGLTYHGLAILGFELQVTANDLGNEGGGPRSTVVTFDIAMDNPFPWSNPADRLDVDGDGNVVVFDAVAIASELRTHGSHALPQPSTAPRFFFDVTQDNDLSVLDLANHVSALFKKFNGSEPAGEPTIAGSSSVATPFDFGQLVDDDDDERRTSLNAAQQLELERTLRDIL